MTTDPTRESRSERRKRQTRERLLQAAFELMAASGMDAVAISEITRAADVGFGSFYNHFPSKEAIHAAVVERFFDEFGDALDGLGAEVADPAEVVAVSVRHTLLRAAREPLWADFLLREGLSVDALARGLGPRLLRDIQRGIAAGRFHTDDPGMAVIAAGGTVLLSVGAQRQSDTLHTVGLDATDLPSRAAAAVLAGLGLSRAAAREVARRPLPVLPT